MAQSMWQLQDAQNRFSELVNKALDQGAQIATRGGVEVVVMVSSGDHLEARFPREIHIFTRPEECCGQSLKFYCAWRSKK